MLYTRITMNECKNTRITMLKGSVFICIISSSSVVHVKIWKQLCD